ncbi:hypothetical protein ATI61_10651 [Archangium gephyra]|uniref:Uncharacterized protein n=1 Tax=Archangium gephyra TaxID=48 RepID=A0AAC8TAC1_9BACT|nr:hypothetical protein [Archangium gephyra]AKI98651.1 Hypothetical protein AA314_00278 [Archangium gephyra]REG30582.1 hypothetical protein ATI61_10651 [Archangium gephyra]
MEQRYPEITDWSKEGRARLVMEHRPVLSEMLRHSLEQVAEPYGVEALLRAFGFSTLEDAVDWSLQAFIERELELTRIPRSWKLFTQPRFWLAQRTGLPGFRRKMAELEALRRRGQHVSEAQPTLSDDAAEKPRVEEELEQQRLRERLIATLRLLRDRTCASLVLWWLRATDGLRTGWFDPPVPPVREDDLSKKARSLITHDALFRFQCLHRQLVQEDGSSGLAHQVVREWLFRPCGDTPPYRRDDAEVARSLPEGAPRQTRALHHLRRQGVTALLEKLIDAAGVPPAGDEVETLFEWTLLTHSVTRTTLTTFKLDEGAMPELARRIDSLPVREAAWRKS